MATSRIKTSSVLQGFPKSRSLLAGNAAYVPDNFESLSTVIVGSGGSSSVTFSSIPQGYAHLQIRGICQTNRSGYLVDAFTVKFNSDSASNYSWHTLYGGFSTTPSVSADGGASTTATRFYWGNSSVSANVFTGVVMDILDYTDTNKYKTIKTLAGYDVNGTAGTDSYGGTICLSSGNWRSNSAITSIEIASTVSSNFTQYTKFALYGIRD